MRASKHLTLAGLLGAVVLTAGAPRAEVFHSRQGALKLAFPQADAIKRKNVFLDRAQLRRISELAGAPVESKLLTVYLGYRNGRLLGHAFFDTHTVRTLPETFMMVVSPAGRVERIQILAFHEPREYLPPPRWLQQFHRRGHDQRLRIGGAIAGIAGSTLSANAIVRATRKILAIHKVIGPSASVGPSRARADKTALATPHHN